MLIYLEQTSTKKQTASLLKFVQDKSLLEKIEENKKTFEAKFEEELKKSQKELCRLKLENEKKTEKYISWQLFEDIDLSKTFTIEDQSKFRANLHVTRRLEKMLIEKSFHVLLKPDPALEKIIEQKIEKASTEEILEEDQSIADNPIDSKKIDPTENADYTIQIRYQLYENRKEYAALEANATDHELALFYSKQPDFLVDEILIQIFQIKATEKKEIANFLFQSKWIPQKLIKILPYFLEKLQKTNQLTK